MVVKEFNLIVEREKWLTKWLRKPLTARAIAELKITDKELFKLLKEDFYHAIMQCELGHTFDEQINKVNEIIDERISL